MYKSQAEAVKSWLLAYRQNEDRIDRQLEKLRMLRARMMSVGAQELSDMPKSGGQRDKMAEYIIQVEALEKSINNDILVQDECRRVITELASQLGGSEQAIIRERYLHGLEWSEILGKLHKGDKHLIKNMDTYRRQMYREHKTALKKMAKLWGKRAPDT